MPQHKGTRLFFSRREEKPYGLHFFHVYIGSWATEKQWNLAWKVATIAYLEGWTLESRDETEESDIVASSCPSLRFNVDLWDQEELTSNFSPADAATFNSSLLERVVKQTVASGSGLSA